MDVDDFKVPRKKSKNGNTSTKKKIKLDSDNTKVSLEDKLKANKNESSSLSDVKEKDNTDIIDMPVVWRHNTIDFLKPEHIRDANKKRPNDPDYDPTTLYVPVKYLDSLTPVGIFLYL